MRCNIIIIILLLTISNYETFSMNMLLYFMKILISLYIIGLDINKKLFCHQSNCNCELFIYLYCIIYEILLFGLKNK